mmetsp:Transcript_18336/g.52327  ORF Transcript_18336/g.52327 Transcript_18336/m.52327 type:complete len:489 (+) Transcript_18336:1826-3292(+)
MFVGAVGQTEQAWRGEQSDGDHSPDAVEHVDGDGVDCVVYSQRDEESGTPDVHPSGDEADHDGSPRLDDCATAGDGDQSAEASVHAHGEGEGRLSGPAFLEPQIGEEGCDAAGSTGQGGGNCCVRGDLADIRDIQQQGGTRVETKPSEPQHHGAQELQRDGVARERLGRLERLPLRVVEASAARSEHPRRVQGDASSRDVHDARPRKVDDAAAQEGVVGGGAEEAVVGPDGVRHDGVHEAGQQHGVAEVRGHLAALRERPGDDGDGRGREGVLEEPEGRAVADVEEAVQADEGLVGVLVLAAEGKRKAHQPEGHGGAAGIQQVLEHGVLHVLDAHAAGAQHGKAALHEEDHGAGDDEQELLQVLVALALLILQLRRHALQQRRDVVARVRLAESEYVGHVQVGFVRPKQLSRNVVVVLLHFVELAAVAAAAAADGGGGGAAAAAAAFCFSLLTVMFCFLFGCFRSIGQTFGRWRDGSDEKTGGCCRCW